MLSVSENIKWRKYSHYLKYSYSITYASSIASTSTTVVAKQTQLKVV